MKKFVYLAAFACMAAAWADMPMFISHRGESIDAPENTMAAFRLAAERGVGGMECDVYVTADGVPVIMHDKSMARTTGISTNITDCTAAFVTNTTATAFGKWASSAYADEKVPTLAQYLELLATSDITAVIELKSGNPDTDIFISAVAAAVQAQSAATKDRVIFIAFSADYVSRIRAALPDYPAYYLVSTCPSSASTLISTLASCNATGVDASKGFDAEYVAAVQAAGYDFATWTVDTLSVAAEQWRMGVDAITTNKGRYMMDSFAEIEEMLSVIDEKMRYAVVTNGLYAFDVGCYVQDGLVANFDGIRNAGATAAHDSAATTWKNIGSNGIDASFVKASGSSAAWKDNGYDFHNAYAIVDSSFALGTEFTVQWVGGIDTSAQTTEFPNFFAEAGDWCIFTRNNAKERLEWKTVSPQLSGSRCMLYDWKGQSFSAVATSTNLYLTEGASYDTAQARSSTSATAAKRWSFGGSPNGPANRYTLGTTHALRVYGRALTEAELAQNFIVDEARFRGLPVTNVVVASEIPELVGAEPNGAYAVEDVHTFTAPSSASWNGNTYTNAGYTLETWNTASNIWGTAATCSGQTYTYTTGVSCVKVRLTWLWAMSEGVRRYDADEYVRNGLILHLDGIRNAGLGRPHSETAATWANLADPDNPAAISQVAGTTNYWGGHGFWFGDGAYAQVATAVDPGLQFTIQVASDCDWYENRQLSSGHHYPTLFASTDDNCAIYCHHSETNRLIWKTDRIDGSNWSAGRSTIGTWNGTYVNAVMNYATHAITHGVTPSSSAYMTGTFGARIGPQRWCVGSGTYGLGARYLTATIFGARLYDRVLTSRDFTLNREIDEVRYRGAVPASDTVFVDSNHRTLGGDDEKGLYTMVGGIARTFAASNVTATVGNKTLSLAGYTLETWNPSTLTWGDPVSCTGTSYTYAAGTGRANVRITWQWKVTRGVKSAYDVDDYVRGGLVALYDGVRNAGAEAEHDASAPVWADLSGNGRHANFRSVAKGLYHGVPYEGEWSDNGRVFSGNSYATMPYGANAGGRYTLQGALDMTPSEQTVKWPSVFGNRTDNGNLYIYDTQTALQFKTSNTTGQRFTLNPWDGKAFTAMVDYDRSVATQTDTLGSWLQGTYKKQVGNVRWMVGSISDNMANDRYLRGTVHGVRMYDRILSQDEMTRNLAVDANRFRGAGLAVTNVIVCSEREGANGVESNGVYEVEGEWTFTAAPFPDTDGKPVFPAGYSLETWTDGAWGEPVSSGATNFTYTVTSESVPVRLTWRWNKNSGATILVR